MGDLYQTLGDVPQALRYQEQALAIIQYLAAREPERLDSQGEVWGRVIRLGDLCRTLGEIQQALKYYRHALVIIEDEIKEAQEACKLESTDYLEDLSVSLERLGDVYQELGDVQQALKYYKQALTFREELAAEDPSYSYKTDLVISYWKMFTICPEEEKVQWLKKARDILKPLSADSPHQEQMWRDILAELQKKGAE